MVFKLEELNGCHSVTIIDFNSLTVLIDTGSTINVCNNINALASLFNVNITPDIYFSLRGFGSNAELCNACVVPKFIFDKGKDFVTIYNMTFALTHNKMFPYDLILGYPFFQDANINIVNLISPYVDIKFRKKEINFGNKYSIKNNNIITGQYTFNTY